MILAGVSIAILTGDNGILTRVQEAKEKTEQAQKDEENILNSYEDKINEYLGIDWDIALSNAQKHPDQKTSTAIGVGTDGRAVNMDLWEYTKLNDGTYALNDEKSIIKSETRTAGYTGNIIEGKIPIYISEDGETTFKSVTNMYCTFLDCSELITFPQIPITVIPNSVVNMYRTFYDCPNLSGIIEINANLNGSTLDNGHEDYFQCFWDVATIEGKSIILKCSENIYNLFYDVNTKNNIKADICYEGVPITLVKQ